MEVLTVQTFDLQPPPRPVTRPSKPPPPHTSLIWVLYPAEKSKDRGSNTIGARLNRVEDKVGASVPGHTGSDDGHGP